MQSLLLSVVAGCALLASPARAQSIAGDWAATINTPGGPRTDKITFRWTARNYRNRPARRVMSR
jgi:hypothetical protein